jgi:SsrA-binding protein
MPTLAKNKKATFNYDLIEKFEGGLVLAGSEVKSAKAGQINMQGAYLTIRDNELWLRKMHISPYKKAGDKNAPPERDRKVLVHKRELKKLIGKKDAQGLTFVPISVYTKGDLVKLSFALARGKKKYEKREDIKKKDIKRQIDREIKKTRFGD